MKAKQALIAISGILVFVAISAFLRSKLACVTGYRLCVYVGKCDPAYSNGRIYIDATSPTSGGGRVYVDISNKSLINVSCKISLSGIESINYIQAGEVHTISESGSIKKVAIHECTPVY